MEGLAYDGTLLWGLYGASIVGMNPATGAVIKTIPNPGSECVYGGTGLMANAVGELTVACISGDWYRVSTADGGLLDSGNNGLDMYGLASSTTIRMNPVYIRSTVGQPWDSTSNEAIMDSVFGAGYWEDLRYEEVDPASLFSGYNNLIFMEGSDDNADELEAFLSANQALLEEWVGYGGCLLLNSAPNEGDGMSFGFDGVELIYPGDTLTATAVNTDHPIFTGPFTPTGEVLTGTSYAHAGVLGGGVTDVLTGNSGYIPLAEKDWGDGHAAFGGMTTTNFHHPQPEATNLRANLLYYLTTFGCQVNYPVVAGDDGTLFFEDFENGYDDWTMDGLWNPESQADTCGAMIDPFPSPNNAAYYGDDATCMYDSDLISGTLTLNTPIALPVGDAPWLVFHSYEQTEFKCTEWDFRYVQISDDDGISWDTLGNLCTENTWYRPSFDLSAYAGQEVRLRFLFDTIDSLSDIFFGWMVDNISIVYPSLFYGTAYFVTQADSPFVTPDVLYNDYDPMYEELNVLSFDDSGMLGTLVSNGDGTFTYDPDGAFDYLFLGEQALETFSYVMGDGVYTDTAQVYILVKGVDDPPVAMPDFYATPNNTALSVPAPGVLGNDYDAEVAPISASLTSNPAVGTLSFGDNGFFTYIPPLGYRGEVTYTYVVNSGLLWSNMQAVHVSFAEPEFTLDAPVDGYQVSSLFGDPIPPLSFSYVISDSPSINATFSEAGPGYSAFNAPPNIIGETSGTLYVDLGTYVFAASFGFSLSCFGTITDAITVTVYTLDMTSVITQYFHGGNTGFGYAENLAQVDVGAMFRSLEIEVNDACSQFTIDNLAYTVYTEPTTVTIDIFNPFTWLPMAFK
jgi:VCBS repeat-containing protein